MELREIARLRLAGGGHVTAASGLARLAGRLWVVSDDAYSIAGFPLDLSEPGEAIALSDEPLPADPVARKAVKPDLESLAVLDDGSLLALGSGSTERRQRGFRVRGRHVESVDLSALYASLRDEIEDLNIEGCAACRGRLWLAQRGNGARGIDALIECTPALELVAIERVDLPDGLSLTDLAPLAGGRLAFAAVHEGGESTYHDGPVTAAAIGVLAGSQVVELHELPEPHKVEGILPEPGGSFLLVADPDDPAQAAPLFRAA